MTVLASAAGLVAVTCSPGGTPAAMLDSIPAACHQQFCCGAGRRRVDRRLGGAGNCPTQLRLVRTGGNIGYGAAAHAGVAVLDPGIDFVLLMNPDVVLGAGSIDELIATAASHPRAAPSPADYHPLTGPSIPPLASFRPSAAAAASAVRCWDGGGR